MTETDEQERKTPLKLSPGRLELKRTVETGQVRQSFSHGRSKVVTVEVRKKRTFAPGAGGILTEVKEQGGRPGEGGDAAAMHSVHSLTVGEQAARARALQEAQRADEEARKHQLEEDERRRIQDEEEAQQRAAEAERKAVEAASEPTTGTTEPALADSETAAPNPVTALAPETPGTAATPAAARPAAAPGTPAAPARLVEGEEEEEDDGAKRPGRTAAHKPVPAVKRVEPRRREGKLTVTAALDEDDRSQRGRSLAAVKRARERERLRSAQKAPEKVVRDVIIPETITVQELANRMAERGTELIKVLMRMGVMATINQSIDADTAELVVGEFGHVAKRVAESDVEIGLSGATDESEHLKSRPPVVTVMGHVDHGKTSLLDALRATDVASGEAGGITQHIGAYQVTLKGGQHITFIDTPGHEAFTAMRARGAKATDIVVLVVAADDGIMPQTIEAIRHAQAAKVPIIVAINKIDRPDANPARVRQELLQHDLVPEELGGEVQCVEVSAKEKINLDKLEEAVLLQAEILDLKANPDRAAQGVVIEAKIERGRGSVATVLVQKGTLRAGDVFVAGAEWGRVRLLLDDHGEKVDEAGPSMPVEVLGLQGTPAAGDDFITVDSELRAREVADYRQRKDRDAKVASGARGTLEQMFSKISSGESKELPVVVKGDVQGSIEAIVNTLAKLGTDEVKLRVLHSAVGGINESDITLAKASNALVIGFNVRANPQARDMARRDNIDIRYYSIIYDVVDDAKQLLSGMLSPTLKERTLGAAEIRTVFNITKVGKVAGCMVTEGVVRRGAKVRLLRDHVVIHEGGLGQLKRFKEDVREVREGYECGITLENYQDIQVGDQIECFEVEEVAATL